MTKQLKLTLYDVPEGSNWTDACKNILESQGNIVQNKGRSRLLTWRENDLRNTNPDLKYVEALDLDPVWLRQRRTGVRLSPRRLYFHGHDHSSPIKLNEFEILGNNNRPATTPERLLRRAVDVGDRLTEGEALIPCTINGTDTELDALNYTRAVGKNERQFSFNFDLWKGVRGVKAFSVPDCFNVMLVLDRSQPEEIVNQYISSLLREWLPELGIVNPEEHFLKISMKEALAQFTEIEGGRRSASLADLVFLVPISGKPGDPLPENQKHFLQVLDRLELQYRCFSFENTEPKWSARSQAMSILQGCGGIPYRLNLPLPTQADDCLIFGVDIGHDHRTRRVSRLVVSVLDKYGLHLASVWMHQNLNEAATSEVLGKMLRQSREKALSRIGYNVSGAIVLRDGMIPKARGGSGAESLSTYLDTLGSDTTVVECRKRGNPSIYIDGLSDPIPAPAGSACSPTDSDVRFVCTHDSLFGLANIFKLNIPQGADGLSIGMDAMTKIITGLCYSPSLGLRPHLPGPIYWAGGIGRTSEHNYKFAGQRAFRFAE